MALYTALPIYKVAYDLLIEIFKRTKRFPGEYKYTIGERLINEALELVINIYKANKSQKQNRLERVAEAREDVETIRPLLQITIDKGFADNWEQTICLPEH
ncbi:MAG TPA: four helix bundle protein [Desulfocapsa sulfexigens]|nr:four helix bundle protein [Desulfocapsa sulfexigens]